jgi:hypothetical protein
VLIYSTCYWWWTPNSDGDGGGDGNIILYNTLAREYGILNNCNCHVPWKVRKRLHTPSQPSNKSWATMQCSRNKNPFFLPYNLLYTIIYSCTILVPNVWKHLNYKLVCVNKAANMSFQLGLLLKTEEQGTMMLVNSVFLDYSLSQTVLTPVNSDFQTHRREKTFVCQTPCHRRIWREEGHTAAGYFCSDSGSNRLYKLWERSMMPWGWNSTVKPVLSGTSRDQKIFPLKTVSV